MELFTRFDGRINRKQWWLGIVILVVAVVLIGAVVTALFGNGLIGRFLMLVISLGALWPALALASRRLHDRGHALLPRAAVFYGPGAVLSVLNAFNIGFRPMRLPDGSMTMMPGLWVSVLGLVSLAAFIWAVIELGVREGMAGENAHGPAPG